MIDFENTAEGLLTLGLGLAVVAILEQSAMLHWLAVGALGLTLASVAKREQWFG